MGEKQAFVFDTNFIIQNKYLNEVVESLKEQFTVYVTQISIDERIAQETRALKTRFEKIAEIERDNSDIVIINYRITYDKQSSLKKKRMQSSYQNLFQERIIPFGDSSLERVLERANFKLPPFSANEKASDKGFKDALIWFSLLDYFAEHGEKNVVFLTDDNAFQDNKEYLCTEFEERTGKKIEIYKNAHYKELIRPELTEVLVPQPVALPLNIDELRDKIEETITSICIVHDEDYWGQEQWNNTFFINQKVDSDYVRNVFDSLEQVIFAHALEKEIPASVVLELDNRVEDGKAMVPLSELEAVDKLYKEIQRNLPDFVEQLYTAVAAIINRYYKEPKLQNKNAEPWDEADIPF